MSSPPSFWALGARHARLVIAWGIVALLLGDVWRLPHLLLSRHVVCREHGELVHEHDEVAPPAPLESRTETARASGVDSASHGHEHCSSLATSARAAAVAPPPPGQVRVLSAEAECELPSLDSGSVSPTTVLVYAPKQGPPA